MNPGGPDTGPVVVALGSNLRSSWGTPSDTIVAAFNALAAVAESGLQRSSLWRTAAVNCPPGTAEFINAVALFTVTVQQTPQALLRKLQGIEHDFGRIREGGINQARTLDLDLICFGNQIINEPGLILPHPRAHQRHFVLQPLAELSPQLVLPGQSATVQQLLGRLDQRTDKIAKIEK